MQIFVKNNLFLRKIIYKFALIHDVMEKFQL